MFDPESLQQNHIRKTPVLRATDDDRGWYATFVLDHPGPETPVLRFDDEHATTPMHPVATRPGRWAIEVTLPPKYLGTYGFIVGDTMIADPHNPVAAGPTRSIITTPDAPTQPHWPVHAPDEALPVPRTRMRWRSELLGRTRTVRMHPSEPGLSLVMLLDGDDWIHLHSAPEAFDSAVAAGDMPPATLAFVPSGDDSLREREFARDADTYARALHDELVPLLEATTSRIVLAGQSLSGLAALWAAVRYPVVFSHVAVQSGSFWWPAPVTGDPLSGTAGGAIADRIRSGDPLEGLEVLLDVGEREPAMHRHTDAVAEALRSRGATVRVTHGPGGHDRTCWRGALLRDTAALLRS